MVTARPLVRPAQTHFETHLQAALEHYLRALRERIPAIIELKGALPVNFWAEEEAELVQLLALIGAAEAAWNVIAVIALRVDELLTMQEKGDISLDMLRYELRIGPLSDARADRFAAQQARGTGENRVFSSLQAPR
jgi:hypothetical protein